MPDIAFVTSWEKESFIEHFNDVAVIRMALPEPGAYLIFGRVVISNSDGDPQNATAQITLDDGNVIADRADVRIVSGGAQAISLQGTAEVDPNRPGRIVDIRCSTQRGYVKQISLFAHRVELHIGGL